MVDTIKFEAQKKEVAGTGVARATRREGRLPAIIYGGKDNTMVSVSSNEFNKEYKKGNLQSKLTTLVLGGKEITVVSREIQTHPVTDEPMHIDFQEVSNDSLIKVAIHIKVVNKSSCPGIKKGGIISISKRYIKVECKPGDMVEHIEIDSSSLDIGSSVHLNDINLPKGVVATDKTNPVIVAVTGRVKEEEALTAEAAEGDSEEQTSSEE